MTRFLLTTVLGMLALGGPTTTAYAQSTQDSQPGADSQMSASGTVVSSTRATLIIKTTSGEFRIYELASVTTRPDIIPLGATVAVTGVPGPNAGAPVATDVRITALPQSARPPQAVGTTGTQAAPDEPIPQGVRNLEAAIQRQTRKYRLGVRGGAALDPELVFFGAQGQLGPFFRDNFWGRPSLELGFGEVTDLVALNFEGIYRAPISLLQNRWSTYFGGGPALVFSKRGFSTDGDNEITVVNDIFDVDTVDNDVDFDDFDLGVGLNIVAGVQSRNGLSFELKATGYAGPSMRFLVGYNFW